MEMCTGTGGTLEKNRNLSNKGTDTIRRHK